MSLALIYVFCLGRLSSVFPYPFLIPQHFWVAFYFGVWFMAVALAA